MRGKTTISHSSTVIGFLIQDHHVYSHHQYCTGPEAGSFDDGHRDAQGTKAHLSHWDVPHLLSTIAILTRKEI